MLSDPLCCSSQITLDRSGIIGLNFPFWAALQKHCLCFQFYVSCMVFQCALPFNMQSIIL